MAANVSENESNDELNEIIKLMWGNNVKEDVFQRWTQGFHFSADEPTALVQWEGGPCAVLAPVQAFIIKSLVSETWTSNWREVEAEKVNKLLIRAACEILCQAYGGHKYRLVHMTDQEQASTSEASDQSANCAEAAAVEPRLDHTYFHSQLRVHSVDSSDEVEAFYLERIQMLRETFGVLLFLYSVMYTKGLEQLHTEVTDVGEPMIDGEYGYGSQCLINLMSLTQGLEQLHTEVTDVGEPMIDGEYGYGSQCLINLMSLTQGLEQLHTEVTDVGEPMIDGEYGYGSQCLINLMSLMQGLEQLHTEVTDVGEPMIDGEYGYGSQCLINLMSLTQGLEQLHTEVTDVGEPMIDGEYGYGSQCLINLMSLTQGLEQLHTEVTDVGEPMIDGEYGYGSQCLINLMSLTQGLEQLHTEVTDVGEPMIDGEYGYGSQCLINLMSLTQGLEQLHTEVTDVGEPMIDGEYGYGSQCLINLMSLTQGLEQLHTEVTDVGEPMIDGEYGYGSQCLINLMITGRAVAHVWNHDQDVGGLKLRGIDKQSAVGFLALLEHLRYCEVGSFLKNPINPVWVLGSETHLTVLFSFEKQLVSAETPTEVARRVFKSFDPEGNNFISSDLLQDVLSVLNLVSDPEYVEIMKKKLDPDNLGIILLSAFMDEFFPEETISVPDMFTLYHYNGLPRSCPNNKVVYQEGSAVLLECNMKCVLDSNPMLTCLQTKWPSIEVRWLSGLTPSLN